MHKIARIAYNSNEWQKPSGSARKLEAKNTYYSQYGFGHEEWLFRSEWLIDGWRYTFVQGVNKSRRKLIEEGKPFDLTLFTIQPDKKRRYVASIRDVECVEVQQAAEVVARFKKLGWYQSMLDEIEAVNGNFSGLGDGEYADSIVNVRFRQENVRRFGPKAYAKSGDPILELNRYQLFDIDKIEKGVEKSGQKVARKGSTEPPTTRSFIRRATSAVECTPEHALIQKRLMSELKLEYPEALVESERDFIDVSVTTKKELILFEIKSDLEPRTVIRQALGQILEYAYHPNRKHLLPLRLVIVGRRPLTSLDKTYLDHLTTTFSLPLTYRVVQV
ncbi:hypothetical protein BI364_01165 [Acidihalobacter yilgarnensis]|uniref:Uncharacterized protein n=1 Tax=Acidihalobacter yilgarnensis TaxID=2819280 RepID=A0A1D8IJZ4_9GAMM|nr:hypothetical protein [Acidihalobacter yilgarnensis]AOU96799.1 hypothetical protein BI364_01165 [Acidihalobacter yilgarnensis]